MGMAGFIEESRFDPKTPQSYPCFRFDGNLRNLKVKIHPTNGIS
jgi:hypothetical protein